MSYFVGIVEAFLRLRNCCYRPGYESPASREEEIKTIDAQSVLPSLPKGIPAIKIKEGLPSPKARERGVRFYKSLIELETLLSPPDYCLRSFWLESKPHELFQKALYNSMGLLLEHDLSSDSFLGEQGWLLKEEIECPTRFKLVINYPKEIEYRNYCYPLGCIVHLQRGKNSHELKITEIEYQGCQYLPGEKNFDLACEIALTSYGTLATIRQHFLYCHILTVQTMYCTAAETLSKTHPIYAFLHPHGYEANHVNLVKGNTLIWDSFAKDFSMDATNLEKLIKIWMQEFELETLTAPYQLKRAGLTPTNVHLCPILEKSFQLWTAFENYATEFVILTYGKLSLPSTHYAILQDKQLTHWYQQLCNLRYAVIPKSFQIPPSFYNTTSSSSTSPTLLQPISNLVVGSKRNYIPLTPTNLIYILTSFMYVSVCLHELLGDAASDVAKHFNMMVIKGGICDKNKLINAKKFFRVVFDQVTIAEYQFSDPKWVDALPSLEYQNLARNLQAQVKSIWQEKLECGINK